MASSSQPAYLPPSVGGPSKQLKEYTKLLIECAQTSLITKFDQYLEDHPLDPNSDKRLRITQFVMTVNDEQERKKALNFLLEHYEASGYHRTGRWLQCAYCKTWHSRHNTLPMIPATDIDNWHCAHHNLCHACLMASHDDQLLHPGAWLRTETLPEELNEPLQTLPQGTPDLTQTNKRPAVLQTLDKENNKETWQPHHWTIAIPSEATQTWHGFIVHAWNPDQQRWVRSPIANPHSDNYEKPQPFNLPTLVKISTKAWHTRTTYSQLEFVQRPRMAVYHQVHEQARKANPGASNTYLRTVTCQQILFISQWAANSVYNMDPQQREQFLDALAQWHEAQAEQAFTGENPIKQYINSQAYTDHLKQFWDAITPTLYHHFLCRNPHCKIVVLNSHWLRTMEHGSHKQGAYLCPNCLETYRPFSGMSYNKNIGQLVQAKQCLVVKVPKDHPANAPLVGGQQLTSDDQEYTYHCFLMEWPEKDTAPFIEQLKLITSNLLEGYQQAVDKVSYLHGQIHLRIRKTQRLSYMKRAAWTQHNIDTINDRNTQSGTNKYKLNLLPQTWDNRLGKKSYYYDFFPYKCDETSTILSPEDTTDLLALIYTQTFLQEYTRDLSQTAKKRRSTWSQYTRPVQPPSHLVCEGDQARPVSRITFLSHTQCPLAILYVKGTLREWTHYRLSRHN